MKLANLKPGDRLRCDFGIGDDQPACVPVGAVRVVRRDGGGLFVRCYGPADDREWQNHYLEGQVGDRGHLVGVRRA